MTDLTTKHVRGHELADLLDSSGQRLSSSGLHAAVRRLVLDGRLTPGTRLPAERELSDAIGVSRTLVARALELLREDGFVESRRGACSWITLPTGESWIADPEVELINLAQAIPAVPPEELGDAIERSRLRLSMSGHGYQPQGVRALRERIAARFEQRGLPTTPEQILITNGAQNAFAHVVQLLVAPGDRVLVEDPTYPNALQAIRGAHAQPVGASMTDEGWDVRAIEAVLGQASPRLAYLIADFQNPTGFRMAADQREQVVAAMRASRTMVVVDETLVDVDLSDRTPPPPVASFGEDQVLTIGSSCKLFWGGLRLGWIRAPREIVRRLVRGRAVLDLGSPVMEQLVLADLLDDPEPVLRRRRSESIERRDGLAAALRDHLPGWKYRIPEGGLSLWCDMGEPIGSRLAVSAEQHGVLLAPSARFGVDDPLERWLRLPFTLPVEQLRDAVAKLAAASTAVRAAPGPGALEAPVA